MAVTAPAVRRAAWNTFRILFVLVTLSRVYALLIYLQWVPDYPDPVLAFIASSYAKLDQLLDGAPKTAGSDIVQKTVAEEIKDLGLVSIIIGNLVFGGFLRYYAPPAVTPTSPAPATPSQEVSKKQQKKQASLLQEVEQEKALATTPKPKLSKAEQAAKSAAMRRNIIIIGRMTQCSTFLFAALRGDDGYVQYRSRHVVNFAISTALTIAEVSGIKWDGGLFNQVLGKKRYDKMLEKDEVVKEKVVDDGAKVKLR